MEAQAKKHSMNITGYIQVQGMIIENNDVVSDEDGFKIRRAKFAASGNAYENVKFKLEADFTRSSSSILDDAFIEDDHLPYLTGKLGQFKVPVSLEMLTSDTEILTIERSEVVNQIAPERDLGIQFSGKLADGLLNYAAGVFNGQLPAERKPYDKNTAPSYANAGRNKTDDNDQKMVAGRVVVKPVDWVSLGVSGLNSEDGEGANAVERTVYGLELQVMNPKRGCSLQGEYLHQRLDRTGTDLNSERFYIQAGHFVVPKHLEVALKYEGYDADTAHRTRDDIRWTTVGLNFYIYGHDAKLMANYIFKNEEKNSYDNDTLLAQLQLRF